MSGRPCYCRVLLLLEPLFLPFPFPLTLVFAAVVGVGGRRGRGHRRTRRFLLWWV
jgi:hypothetical protein